MSALRSGDVVGARFQVLEAAGETALYHAFRARDLQGTTDERQADTLLKVVRAELAHDAPSRTFLIRELLRVRALSQPGLLRPSEVFLHEDQRVILAEAINPGLSQGVSLHRLFTYRRRESERFALEEVRKIGVQLAPTLSYVHGQFLCHGDLRLESVLLRPDGVRLCDVGVGRALPRGPYLDAVRTIGEEELLAPEVRAGRPPDARSDIFALAALYKHLVSLGERAGWEAFCGERASFSLVLTRSLSENPEQRHQTIEELVAELEAVALTGGPLRKRQGPNPLAMAVAAGRLPPEELNRPIEEVVPDNRRRRNSGAFELSPVLLPLASSPSGRSSIGSIPPRTTGQHAAVQTSGGAAAEEPARREPKISNPGVARRGARSLSSESLSGTSSASLPPRPSSGTAPPAQSAASVPSTNPSANSNPARPTGGTVASAASAPARPATASATTGPARPASAASASAQSATTGPARPSASGVTPAASARGRRETPALVPRATPKDAGDDVGGMATRPVNRVDLDELRAMTGAAPAGPSAPPSGQALRPSLDGDDIGGQHTVAFDRQGADPKEAPLAAPTTTAPAAAPATAPAPVSALRPLLDPAPPGSGLRPLIDPASAPAPASAHSPELPDQTIEQARLDSVDLLQMPATRDTGDLPTSAYERLTDSEVSSAPPRAPRQPVDLSVLPPLAHETPRPLVTGQTTSPGAAARSAAASSTPSGGSTSSGRARAVHGGMPGAVPIVTPPAGSSLPPSHTGSPQASPPAGTASVPAAIGPRTSGQRPASRGHEEPLAMATTPSAPIVVAARTPRSGTPTQQQPQRSPRRGSRLVALVALLVSALIGALTAVALVTLFRSQRGPRPDQPGPEAPRTPEPRAPEPVAPKAPEPVAKAPEATITPKAPEPVAKAPEPVAPQAPPSAAPKAPEPVAKAPDPAAPKAPPSAAPSTGACPATMVSATLPSGVAFCIDRHEFPGSGQPRVNVSIGEAEAACKQAGSRLCTGDEWEAACRGRGRASYPYGPEPRPDVCNIAGGALQSTGSRPACVSAAGALDMAGNAAEWVRGSGVRGGSAQGEGDGRCSRWLKAPPGGRGPFLGFRCCR